jgi:SAM-dependent methyltransferase
MPDAHYENQKLAAIYDLFNPWSADNDFYLALAGPPPQQILDLGCGTGLLCAAYAAQGHRVTGVDPTPAMLAVARQKPHGDAVHWVLADAQTFDSTERFDLIIMTGHVFQVFLDDAAVHAVFTTMRRLLKPTGKIVFESRNPAIDWAAAWNGTYELTHAGVTMCEITQVLTQTDDRISFEMQYQFPDETLVSRSELRFLSRSAIEVQLAQAGLHVAALYGDWDQSPFDPTSSKELIFVVERGPA